MKAQASAIASWVGGRLHGNDTLLVGVSQDSRRMPPGGLFVALPGERVDGHDFLPALVGHAGAALVQRARPELALAQIEVSDVLVALQQLARHWLAGMRAQLLALTGSNGKTTTKSLLAGILARVGSCWATPGNYNNEIGVPLTVLGLSPEHAFAVIEMGCGKPGDIDELVAIAPPDAALVTNIAAAHLERLGSVAEVARSKAGIYRGLRPGGIAAINADDPYAPYFREQAGGHPCLDFAIDAKAAVRAEDLRIGLHPRFRLCTPQGSRSVELPLPGRHNVMNALAASALAVAAGASLDAIVAGLQEAESVAGRQRRIVLDWGVLYDDSYNANPGSLAAAIDTLALEAAPRWLVLGDMGELGPQAAELHAEGGARARAAGIERLHAVGTLSASTVRAFGAGGCHYPSVDKLIDALHGEIASAGTALAVLVKGSRTARMERVVAALAGQSGGGRGS